MLEQTTPDARTRTVVFSILGLLLLLHALLVWRALPRAIDHDEGEHLRAAAWLASGKTLYRDFVENHTPFLYLLLSPAAPETADIEPLRQYVTVARVLSGLAGTAAVLFAAAFAARMAGSAVAAVPVLAALFAGGWTWLRGIADVRAEPFTLLLFWAGAWLVLRADATERRSMLAGGAGVGLMALSALWNPKWPLECAILGVWYAAHWLRLARRAGRDALLSALAAALPPAIGFCIALTVTTPRDLIYYSYVYTGALAKSFATAVVGRDVFPYADPFAFCPIWFRPTAVAAVVAVMAIIWIALRKRLGKPPVLVMLLVLASALELRFLYQYPRLWPQYFVMWACVVSVLYGVCAAWLTAQLRSTAIRAIALLAILAVWLTHQWSYLTMRVDERHWAQKQELRRRLQPGEAAWVRPEELPVPVPAGAYYWYAFDDQVPLSLEYARTDPAAREFLPLLRDEELPPCRILAAHRAAPPPDYVHVRLIDQRAVRNLPKSRQCLEQLFRGGLIRRVDGTPIWEVRPPSRRTRPPI